MITETGNEYLFLVGGTAPLEILDISANSWFTGLPSMNILRSQGLGCALWNNERIYAWGGWVPGSTLDSIELLTFNNDINDISNQQWNVLTANLIQAVYVSHGFVYGTDIIIIGGMYTNPSNVQVDMIQVIDTTTNQVTQNGATDIDLACPGIMKLNGKIYSFGGYNNALSVVATWRYFTLPPTPIPTVSPTDQPTNIPTVPPTDIPTDNPTDLTEEPTNTPSNIPTITPTKIPTNDP
eukprot:167457_1